MLHKGGALLSDIGNLGCVNMTGRWMEENSEFLRTMLDNMWVSINNNNAFLTNETVLFEYIQKMLNNLLVDISNNYPDEYDAIHENSLVIARFYELIAGIDWHRVSIFSSAYEPALRDLRYYLEDMVAAYYLDHEYPNDTNEEKMIHYEKLPFMKKRLKLCQFEDGFGHKTGPIYSLYRKLCGFAHPSTEILRESHRPWNARLGDGIERFHQAFNLHGETYDMLIAIVIHRFPELMKVSNLQMFDTKTLKMMKFHTTLSLIHSG